MHNIIDFPNCSSEASRRFALQQFEEAMREYELLQREAKVRETESKIAKLIVLSWTVGLAVGCFSTILAINLI